MKALLVAVVIVSLLRAIVRLGLKAAFLRPVLWALMRFINGDQARFRLSNPNFRLVGAIG